MAEHPVRTPEVDSRGYELLQRLVTTGDGSPFAVLHRPRSVGGALEVLVGDVRHYHHLADLPLDGGPASPAVTRQELVVLVPFRQVTERGYDCRDDNEPILAISVTEQGTVPIEDAWSLLPQRQLQMTDTGCDVDDQTYAELVRTIIREEIGQGSGSNFVLQRAFTATIEDYSPAAGLALFGNLLRNELGAYWTFIVHTGSRTFVGATPERHLSLEGGALMMNPISGTLRYPAAGPVVSDVLEFLGDAKETDELQMVVDEELKMMAAVCDDGVRIIGPYLKEMARVAHTEYLIQGQTALDIRTLLRATMFAPTVTGSPLENACRVLARHELTGRGYYSGIIAVIGRDGAGRQTLDSSILIRTADIDETGRLAIRIGATIVRHSDPASEVLETHAKAAGLLEAANGKRPESPASTPARSPSTAGTFLALPAVTNALAHRNDRLARFWLDRSWSGTLRDSRLVGRRILVVDAEDTFTAMLGHQLRALGLRVDIVPYDHRDLERLQASARLVLIGPGPGDPRDLTDPKMATLRALTDRALDSGTPLVSICLGHQVLATALGLPIVRKQHPSQGLQRDIDLFGRVERVGFYNTFSAIAPSALVASERIGFPAEISRDEQTGEVHAMRGNGFASLQFHPESVLTKQGPQILADLITWSVVSRVDHFVLPRAGGDLSAARSTAGLSAALPNSEW